jgi:hypothetical protein
MPTFYSGKIQENILEEWHDGTQNLWNMTSNWFTYKERRTDKQMLSQRPDHNPGEDNNKQLGGITTKVLQQSICPNDKNEGHISQSRTKSNKISRKTRTAYCRSRNGPIPTN